MSLREILWRLYQKLQIPADYFRHKFDLGAPTQDTERKFISDKRVWFHSITTAGSVPIDIFDMSFPAEKDFDWLRDYHSDTVSPLTFASFLNTKESDIVGDIKYVWEINRHQHLSIQAVSASNTGKNERILRTLNSWVRSNPYMRGVNWTSSLELGLRIISWSIILDRLRAREQAQTGMLEAVLHSAERQLDYIARHLSKYSSANNHIIGEAAGLYVGSTVFSWMNNSSIWRCRAKSILEREIIKQITTDGINREQSTSYQLFTLEIFLISQIMGMKSEDPFSTEYQSRLKAMLDYLYSIATDDGDLPDFGDGDDSRGFKVSTEKSPFKVVMELGAVLFEEPKFLRYSETPGLTTEVLLGDGGVKKFHILKSRESRPTLISHLFEEGGRAILVDSARRIKVVMDFGDHGYESIAAHAHADALSIQLALDNKYVLIDPGTYCYYSYPEWRDYFRGSAAHNTIRIDGLNQSVIGGRFLWNHQAKSRLLEWTTDKGIDYCLAEHDGYHRLHDPVIHRRRVALDKLRSRLEIRDTLECRGSHEVEVFFHLHEESRLINRADDSVTFEFQGRSLTFNAQNEGFKFDLLNGREQPISGWRSRSFYRKIAINTLCYSGRIEETTDITTIISIGE